MSTHWGWGEMVAIFWRHFYTHFLEWKFVVYWFIEKFWSLLPNDFTMTYYQSALVQVIAQCSLLATWACCRCVTHLGRPISVHKSDVECTFLSQNGQMTWKVKIKDPYWTCFGNSWKNPKIHTWCKFCNSSSNLLQVITWTSRIS